MAKSSFITIEVILTLALYFGCSESKQPTGPDNGVPIFHLEAESPTISPGNNTALRLTPVLPIDFENLAGQWVWFSCQPDSGYFTVNPSRIDLNIDGNLYPKVWFGSTGTANNISVSLFAHVITQMQDTTAWDSCTVRIE